MIQSSSEVHGCGSSFDLSFSAASSVRNARGRTGSVQPATCRENVVERTANLNGRAGVASSVTASDRVLGHVESSRKILNLLIGAHCAVDSKSVAPNKKRSLFADSANSSLKIRKNLASGASGSADPTTDNKISLAKNVPVEFHVDGNRFRKSESASPDDVADSVVTDLTHRLSSSAVESPTESTSCASSPERTKNVQLSRLPTSEGQQEVNTELVNSTVAHSSENYVHAPKSRVMTGGETSIFPEDRSLRLLAIQALLLQFRDPAVRDDFSCGKISFAKSKCVQLEDIDELACAMLPSWLPGSDGNLLKTQTNLNNLINQSSEHLSLQNSKVSKTFVQWYKILCSLASSNYWTSKEHLADNDIHPNLMSAASDEYERSKKSVVHVRTLANGVAAGSSGLCSGDELAKPCRGDNVGNGRVHVNESPPTISLVSYCGIGKENHPSVQPQSSSLSRSKSDHPHDDYVSSLDSMRGSPQSLEPEVISSNVPSNSIKFVPTCSICGGKHLGMHCRAIQLQLKCHWCGRFGHDEESCWRKSGACLICGSANHRLRQCARYIPLRTPIFPPWCSGCGGNHLGLNCDSPYME